MSGRFDLPLIMTWLLLVALGTVMIASASVVATDASVVKHGLFLTAGRLCFCGSVCWCRWTGGFPGHRLAWLGAIDDLRHRAAAGYRS